MRNDSSDDSTTIPSTIPATLNYPVEEIRCMNFTQISALSKIIMRESLSECSHLTAFTFHW